MWNRAIIKSNAKIAIGQGRYWTCFGVIVTASILAGIIGGVFGAQYSAFMIMASNDPYGAMAAMGGMAGLGLISFLVSLFVVYPLTIGQSRFFVQNRFGRTEYNNVFSGFKTGYLNGVGAMFVTELFIGLWSLLFIVPGIIKSLQYTFVPYILSDNPHLTGSRARQISRTMTNGEKGAIFVLELSFIGWFLLPAIAAGIFGIFSMVLSTIVSTVGMWFIMPYYQATITELYVFLRDRSIQAGMVDPAELCLTPLDGAAQ